MLSLLPFLVIIVVFWFFMTRSQSRRQRAAQQLQSALNPGAKVMLTSGIFGTVAEITDDYVLVEVSETTSIKVIRAAIGRVLPEDFGEEQPETDGADDAVVAEPADDAGTSGTVEPIDPIDPEEKH